MRVNIAAIGRHVGEVLTLDVDRAGVIKDRFWRERLAESKIDGCVEIVTPAAKASAKKTEI